MKKLLALILLFFWCNAESQNLHDSVLTDSALRMSVDTIDSLQVAPLPPPPPIDSIKINLQYSRNFDSVRYLNHPFFSFKDPIRYTVTERKRESKEAIFYSIIGLLIFFAVIKNAFRRYFEDLWKVFLRTSMRQKQLKEQLLQSPLPSLLFNIFFFFSGGLFLALMLQHFRLVKYNFWLLTLYSIVGLAAIYATKYLFLKISGWLFQAYEAANTY
ncbi:MAG TPA: DUF4271 domain-containing protein, partial [Flavisolibacter sp.]|nr:DUF4271 domain-containing protein [Flavisolibacter sp.]